MVKTTPNANHKAQTHFQAALPCKQRQSENHPNGASAARRHFGKPTMLCLKLLVTSRRRSTLFQAAC